jgi:hypothetical protein
MSRSKLTIAGVCLLASSVPAFSAPIVFTVFTAPPPGSAGTISITYAGNKFVGSVQKDGTGALYSTDLTGGNVQSFAPTVSLAGTSSSEHFLASSLGLGGFPSRDIYVASGNGVVHISNDGTSSNTFVTGLNGLVRGILFDPVGTFGNNMLVTTTAGGVYEVDSLGHATLLASTGEDTEGMDVAPLGGGFGAFDGQLIVGSEGSGTIRAIAPNGAIHTVTTVSGVEEVSFVPLNLGTGGAQEGFYGADYTPNVVKAAPDQFTGFLGDLIVTGEFTHTVTRIHFNGTTFVDTPIGTFPNQPEDGLFVTAAIVNPGGGGSTPEPATLVLIGSGMLGLALLRRKRA